MRKWNQQIFCLQFVSYPFHILNTLYIIEPSCKEEEEERSVLFCSENAGLLGGRKWGDAGGHQAGQGRGGNEDKFSGEKIESKNNSDIIFYISHYTHGSDCRGKNIQKNYVNMIFIRQI